MSFFLLEFDCDIWTVSDKLSCLLPAERRPEPSIDVNPDVIRNTTPFIVKTYLDVMWN